MPVGRPFEFPVPEDRTINHPHTILESREILGLYNQGNNTNAQRVVESVQIWLEEEAKKIGWETVIFVEGQAILGLTSLHYGN
ncbi:MAG: hypothetical protein NTW85_16945 [Methylococcales bacterium]|nr:hypothetical protein [Methylococcales bacterium]